ncbi:MAG: translation initiation factor IF-2 [Acetobacteraceae bacterium]
MTEGSEQEPVKGRLSLRPAARPEVGRTVDAGSVRQSFSHGRSKVVQVEVRRKRAPSPPAGGSGATPHQPGGGGGAGLPSRAAGGKGTGGARALTATELAARQKALAEQQREQARREAERREAETISILSAAEEARRKADEEAKKAAEEAARAAAEEEAKRKAEAEAKAAEEMRRGAEAAAARPEEARRKPAAEPEGAQPSGTLRLKPTRPGDEEDEARPARRPGAAIAPRRPQVAAPKKSMEDRRRGAKIDVQAAIEGEDERVRSLASVRRQRERERRQAELELLRSDQVKVVREVVLPESITVQELASRMAVRTGDVIKGLMKLGVMATITQTLDADAAELVVQEFGHRAKRVSEADVELGLEGRADAEAELATRPPVVTVMGHVDHGKTSLLDALRSTDVAGGEAGGITQHIGAYQVVLPSGARVTFIDTPGHEAFTALRARGASVTDIVVLVVAADDGVMPQTVEAIRHAQAAHAPIIVAINKMDKPGANPQRVRNELLQHEVVVEEMGGETQDVEVSALQRTGLDRLLEAILVQAEILELKANPGRPAEGTVIESRLDRGRGPVATVLVQKGTLHRGDIVVAGAEWGRVRALLDERNRALAEAGPSTPVEIHGLAGVPVAGEPLVAVENEARAREVAEFRQRRLREKAATSNGAGRGTLEQMLARISAGEQKEVACVIKADVQGSAEAIQATVLKLGNDEVKVRVLHSAVGQITESDVVLAKASSAVVVGFNVRATAQARALAGREDVEIRYYSIIYELADDIEKLVKGRVAPKARERFLGYAEVRKVFEITKIGKVAGCMVTDGLVRRGTGVRLLRDGIVIHTGELAQLKRFKDDVREVAKGYECGLAFAGWQDVREGDVVECFESELVPA